LKRRSGEQVAICHDSLFPRYSKLKKHEFPIWADPATFSGVAAPVFLFM
jgi:hypothetical protein